MLNNLVKSVVIRISLIPFKKQWVVIFAHCVLVITMEHIIPKSNSLKQQICYHPQFLRNPGAA